MANAPTKSIPELIKRNRPLTWDAIKKLELDYDIQLQHLESKEKALQEAWNRIEHLEKMIHDIYLETTMAYPVKDRPSYTRIEEQATFIRQVTEQLRTTARNANIRIKVAQRRFTKQKDIIEQEATVKIETLKTENFKARAKYRAAMAVLKSNGLVLDESLVAKQMDPDAKEQNEEYLTVKMVEASEQTVSETVPSEEDLITQVEQETDNAAITPQDTKEPLQQAPNQSDDSKHSVQLDESESNVSSESDVAAKSTPNIETADSEERIQEDSDEGFQEIKTDLIKVPMMNETQNSVKDETTTDIPQDALETTVSDVDLTRSSTKSEAGVAERSEESASQPVVRTIKGYTYDDLVLLENTDSEEDVFTPATLDPGNMIEFNAEAIEQLSNPEVMSVLELFGKNGWYRQQEFMMALNVSEPKIRRIFDFLSQQELVDSKTIKTLKSARLNVYWLSPKGQRYFQDQFGKEAKESRLRPLIRDHANLEHAIGIVQINDFYSDLKEWRTENRRSKTILESPVTKRLFAPDIIAENVSDDKEESGKTRYIEFERGNGHDSMQFREWVTRRIEWSSVDVQERRWYIYVPTQELVGKLQGKISEIYASTYVQQGLDTQFNASFIIKSATKLFAEGIATKQRDLLPLGKNNPDSKWKRPRSRR